MTIPFTRQLGARSGIQLNPLRDNTGGFVTQNGDQIVAMPLRSERGRIDKAFRVNSGNLASLLGKATSPTVSRLHEARVQLYEALASGAYEAVVTRLRPAAAVLSTMYAKADPLEANVWTVATTAPTGYLIAFKHLECFNDGVIMEIHAEAATDSGGAPAASKIVSFRLRDVIDNSILYEFEGSLDPLAKDEFGNSSYLPNVVSATTDAIEITVPTSATVPITSIFYGVDSDGAKKYTSKALSYFSEGGTTYDAADYDRAVNQLFLTEYTYGYILSGGTQNASFLSKLIALGTKANKQLLWDIGGDLSPAAAITFYASVNPDTHYSQCYWAPLYADDPVNGGKAYLGTSGINAGLRCARNAQTDANGIAPKNYPVAGKAFPVSRTSPIQKYNPTEQEQDDLAKSKINPILFIRYNDGGSYVFNDSLTGAKTSGDRKLIAVADMASSVDDWVTQFGLECLQLPMLVGIKRMTDFLQSLFEGIEAAGWIKPSAEPFMGKRSFIAEVKPNAQRPNDRMDVNYWLKYDGTTRAIYIQQTLTK